MKKSEENCGLFTMTSGERHPKEHRNSASCQISSLCFVLACGAGSSEYSLTSRHNIRHKPETVVITMSLYSTISVNLSFHY